MKTAGIIAEYNPFHNGHQYHIKETRRRTGAEYVIVAMSGSFVQRGAPSVLDKYDRARMALLHGADLVFELPSTASLRSAEGFASGGIRLLDSLGVVDTVCCGCESAYSDPALFAKVASLLAEEPEEFRKSLAESLRSGMNYPRARETAVRTCLGDVPEGLLSDPNDTLALEYARAIDTSGSKMELCLIPRQGSGRHTASEIRTFLLSDNMNGESHFDLSGYVPADIFDFLLQARSEHRLLCENDLSGLLFYALTVNRDRINEFGPKNFDLSNRIANLTERFTDWSGFIEILKTKNLTYTAVSRCLSQILLGIRRDDLLLASKYGNAPYARLLGFRKKAAPVLKAVLEKASIPVIMNPAHDYSALGEKERYLFDFDIRAAEICRQNVNCRSGLMAGSEFRQPILTV